MISCKSSESAIASFGSLEGSKTYVVGSLGDVAEGRWGELGDNLLDLDVFRHDGGIGEEVWDSGKRSVVVAGGQ